MVTFGTFAPAIDPPPVFSKIGAQLAPSSVDEKRVEPPLRKSLSAASSNWRGSAPLPPTMFLGNANRGDAILAQVVP
jgi:hypothetical protein